MQQTCKICSSSMSEPVPELFALPSVASDCRPWSKGRSVSICGGCGVMKRVTNADFNPDVYKEYTSYPEPAGRTKKVLEFVDDKIEYRVSSVLDIGCGKGDGIAVLQQQYPFAKVNGYEPTIHKERPVGKYDLITLFHVFEHVEDLHEMLDYIKSSLTENGYVLIQVPYAAMWPFDLVIADHEWHFTKCSLGKLFDDNGFYIKHLGNDAIKKELTLLACIKWPIPIIGVLKGNAKSSIDWLLSFKSKLDTINEPVAVYGTSVSAMWATSILGNKVVAYLDDDISRQHEFNDRRVWMPDMCDLPIVAPFPDWQLAEIKAKHPNLRFL